jgi:hypothetical protein
MGLTAKKRDKIAKRLQDIPGITPAMVDDLAATAKIGMRVLPRYFSVRIIKKRPYIYARPPSKEGRIREFYVGQKHSLLEYFLQGSDDKADDPRQLKLSKTM